jgi:hypothetical protein
MISVHVRFYMVAQIWTLDYLLVSSNDACGGPLSCIFIDTHGETPSNPFLIHTILEEFEVFTTCNKVFPFLMSQMTCDGS